MTQFGRLLRVVALVCFLLAALVALGEGTFRGADALVPAGLAAWVAGTLL